jgi:hypothetical protein
MASRTKGRCAKKHQAHGIKGRSYQVSFILHPPHLEFGLLVGLALELSSLALGLALELGSLSLGGAGNLVGLALGLGCCVGSDLLDLLGDFLCACC